jgi:SAM-dependent methyltransferase
VALASRYVGRTGRRGVLLLSLCVFATLAASAPGAPPDPAPDPHPVEHAPTPRSEPPAYRHRFEHAEEWARQFDDPSRDAWQKPDLVVAAMQIAPGMTVADIGAGTGYFESYLSRAVGPSGRVFALDIEPDMVRYLKDRASRERLGNVEARRVAPDDPGLPAASVDRVLVVDTWHHISNRAAYAAHLLAALKPGGQVFVVDFRRDAERGPPPEHRIDPEEVARELSAGGLVAHPIHAALPEQYVVVGARP